MICARHTVGTQYTLMSSRQEGLGEGHRAPCTGQVGLFSQEPNSRVLQGRAENLSSRWNIWQPWWRDVFLPPSHWAPTAEKYSFPFNFCWCYYYSSPDRHLLCPPPGQWPFLKDKPVGCKLGILILIFSYWASVSTDKMKGIHRPGCVPNLWGVHSISVYTGSGAHMGLGVCTGLCVYAQVCMCL